MVVKKKLNIIIFGASGSIGSFLVNRYFQNRCNLLLYFKNPKQILKFKKKYRTNKLQKIIYEKLDINNENDIKKKIFKNRAFFQNSDIIINTIGEQGDIKNFFDLDLKKFYKTFNINFLSQISLLRKIYTIIRKNKNTLLVLFSGGGVTSERKNFSPYILSKICLVKLVEILKLELRNKGLRINAISPGVIDSKMSKSILKKSKKIVDVQEIRKIKKEITNSKKSLVRIYKLIDFLISQKGKKISGKIISSRWDKFEKWNKKDINKIIGSDIFTLRRNQKL